MDQPVTSVTSVTSVTRPRLRSSRTLAAFLSFLAPGAGQILTGRLRAGLLFLVPLAALVGAAVGLASGDRATLLGIIVQPGVLLSLLILDGALLVWRVSAIVDAWRGGHEPAGRSRLGTGVVVALLLVTVGTHLVIGEQVMAARDTVQAVFGTTGDEDDGFGELPDATGSPTAAPTPTPIPEATTSPTLPWLGTAPPTPTPAPTPRPNPLTDGRLDVLLVGADSGPGRWSLRTDTLIVLSVDVRSGEAALFSIPRNLVNVPLPKESRQAFACRCFPEMINALYVYASQHPGQFPGKDETRGLRAVQMAIGTLIGRKLDGMVVVELQGFVKLIDAVGGLDITVPEPVYDARYPLENGRGSVEIHIRAGKQHMNGRKALMYARSRHQDSDYGRMERQQIVLSALGRQLQKEQLLVQLPELMKIARKHLWTNLKLRDLPTLVQLAEATDIKGMTRIRFVPPTYPEYLGRAAIKRIRTVVAEVFDGAVPRETPSASGSPPAR